jgi:peptide/nickel transport system permease protein
MTTQTTTVDGRTLLAREQGPALPSRIWGTAASTITISTTAENAPIGCRRAKRAAVFANVIAPHSPTQNDVGPSLEGPSTGHLMGTDQFGRDVFSRIVHGARISLYVGLLTTLLGTGVATFLGSVSGYRGGVLDYIVQRFVDASQAIPPLILLIGVMVVLGPSVTNVILALAFRQALSVSRVIRSAVIAIRMNAYVESARTVGATQTRVLLLHILPNVVPVIVVLVSSSIGGLIVAEASLSFLGYGVPPPTPSWGGMMSAEGRIYMLAAPWMLIFPTIVLSLVVFAMNMFGDALRDEIDPRLRGSR